jgi:hypothetical protein
MASAAPNKKKHWCCSADTPLTFYNSKCAGVRDRAYLGCISLKARLNTQESKYQTSGPAKMKSNCILYWSPFKGLVNLISFIL